MTIEEELSQLDDSLRRLKVEYDVFFGGGSKKPPTDLEWRVQSLLKKHGENGKLSFAQRFRYNGMAQKYAVFSDLWRQKMKVKEEGYRRPQDVLLGIQGMRGVREDEVAPEQTQFLIRDRDDRNIESLFEAMSRERERAGLAATGTLESFAKFVKHKTSQLSKQFGCEEVEFAVEVESGQVRLKARAK